MNTSLNLYSGSYSDSFSSWWTFSKEMHRFCSFHQKPDSRNFWKVLFLMFFLSTTKHLLLNNYKRALFHQTPNWKSDNYRGLFDWKKMLKNPSIILPTVGNFSQCLKLLICCVNQTHNYQYLHVWFLQPKTTYNIFRLWRTIQFREFLFWSKRRIFDSPNIPKVLFYFILPVIQTFNSESSPVQFPSSKSQSKTF